jgi:hypothetical protein
LQIKGITTGRVNHTLYYLNSCLKNLLLCSLLNERRSLTMNAKDMLPAWTNIARPIYQSPDLPHQAYNNSRTTKLGTLLSAPTLSASKIEED